MNKLSGTCVSTRRTATWPGHVGHQMLLARQPVGLSRLCGVRGALRRRPAGRTYAAAAEDLGQRETGTGMAEDPVVQEKPKTPAELDGENFQEMPSVEFWRTWMRRSPVDDVQDFLQSGGGLGALDLGKVRSLAPFSASEWGLYEEGSFRYWSYHLLRSGFFVAQAAAGITASQRTSSEETSGRLLANLTTNAGLRLYTEALQMFRQDFANIKAGAYREPYDMDPRHRQFSPSFILRRTLRFLEEAPRTLKRRSEGVAEDVWLKSPLYPEYYMNTVGLFLLAVLIASHLALLLAVALPDRRVAEQHQRGGV